MAKAAAVVPDKKLLALHKKRAKGHGVDAFIAECVKKNLGFKPELKAYDFAATPELLAQLVDYHEERRSPRLSDPKLAQRALALRKQLG